LRIFRPILREDNLAAYRVFGNRLAELFRRIFGGRKFGGEYG